MLRTSLGLNAWAFITWGSLREEEEEEEKE
jgi:hypothetical protein